MYNERHFHHTSHRKLSICPELTAADARITRLQTARATFDHLFTNLVERESVIHKIRTDWTNEHGLDSTPSLDYLVDRLTAQIETKRAQLLQDGDNFSEPTLNEIQ